MDILVHLQVKDNCQPCRHNLSEYRSRRCARNTHFGKAKEAENQNRVENNINHCAQTLGNHGIHGPSGGLQQLFKGHLGKHTDRTDTYNRQIGYAVGYDFLILCLA